jgi:hypothetical protein
LDVSSHSRFGPVDLFYYHQPAEYFKWERKRISISNRIDEVEMSNATFWFSPPILIIIFMVLGALLLLMGRVISAKGEYNRTKHLHYSCGEDLDAPHVQVSYHAFFRLALLFSICI